MTSPFDPPLLGRSWPRGQHYTTLSPPAGRPEALWVSFKLTAAGWYLDTLQRLFDDTGDLDRFIGVEMALDGFLATVSSAFDAATAALIEAIEYPLPPLAKTGEHDFSWGRCLEAAVKAGAVLSCLAAVESALAGA